MSEKVTLALFSLGVYMAIMLFIGWLSSKKIKNLADYIVAGRRLGLALTFGTILATWFCSGTAFGGAAMAYLFGLRGVIMDPLGAALCILLFGLFFAKIMRKLRYLTIADFFRYRYGKEMELLSSIVQVLAYIAWTSGLIISLGYVFQVFLGVPYNYGIIVSIVITLAYTLLGGMWSVTLTDLVQMLLFIIAFIAAIPVTIAAAGGLDNIFKNIPISDYSILPGENWFYLGYVGMLGLAYYVSSWIVQGMGSLSCQDLVQRALSAKDEKVSVRASILAGIAYATLGLIPAILGLWARIIIPNIDNPDVILPTLALKVFPLPLFILFTVAVLAAIMSSTDSALLVVGSVVAQNIAPIVAKSSISEKGKIVLAKTSIIAAALVCTGIALLAPEIYKLINFSWALILMVQGIPFILGIYWKRANRTGALACVVTNIVLWVLFISLLLPHTLAVEEGNFEYALWDAIYIADIPALIIGLIVFIMVSLLTQKRDPPKPLMSIDGKIVEPKNFRELFGLS